MQYCNVSVPGTVWYLSSFVYHLTPVSSSNLPSLDKFDLTLPLRSDVNTNLLNPNSTPLL